MPKERIQAVVLDAIRLTNAARDEADHLPVSLTSPLFGPESSLDSMGLVALLIDVEEGLLEAGIEVSLSDERAMAQEQNPFATAASLVDYVLESASRND